MSQKKPFNWYEYARSYPLTLSASQIDTYKSQCKRKWWLKSVRKVKSPPRGSTTFGDILHLVCERWLGADDSGYDVDTGKPVELYPKDWYKGKNKYTGEMTGDDLEALDRDKIQKLVNAAIKGGVLVRLPGRSVERPFDIPVCKGEWKDQVRIVGLVDYGNADTIQDHKSVKIRRYAKSKNALKKNVQLLMYAKEHFDFYGEEAGDKVVVQHNNFCKDPKDLSVFERANFITKDEATAFWNSDILVQAKEMKKFRQNAETWSDVPECEDKYKGCDAYGGCEYLPICSGQCTVDQFIARQDKPSSKPKVTINSDNEKNAMSNLMNQMKKSSAAKKSAKKKQKVTLNSPLESKVETKQEVSKVASEHLNAMPWAFKGCSACAENVVQGLNSKLEPCPICNAENKKAGTGISSNHFEFEIETIDNTTNISWSLKEAVIGLDLPQYEDMPTKGVVSFTEEVKVTVQEEIEEEEEEVVEAPKKLKKKVSKVLEVEDGVEVEDDDEVSAFNPNKLKFSLFLGASIKDRRKRTTKVLFGEDIVNEGITAIMEELGEDSSFYSLDSFARKDNLRIWTETVYLPSIQDTSVYIVFGQVDKASDTRAVAEVLAKFAPFIVEGSI